MEKLERLTRDEMKASVECDRGLRIGTAEKSGGYQLIERGLCAQSYRGLKRSEQGTISAIPG